MGTYPVAYPVTPADVCLKHGNGPIRVRCGVCYDEIEKERDMLRAEVEKLEKYEIVDGMKADCIGEFAVSMPEIGDDGNEFIRSVNVPWTIMKRIYRMMHESRMAHMKAAQAGEES